MHYSSAKACFKVKTEGGDEAFLVTKSNCYEAAIQEQERRAAGSEKRGAVPDVPMGERGL